MRSPSAWGFAYITHQVSSSSYWFCGKHRPSWSPTWLSSVISEKGVMTHFLQMKALPHHWRWGGRASATFLYQKIKLGGWYFPGGSVVKNLPAKAEDISDVGSNLWVGKILGRRKWQPNPVFLPGKSHGQRTLAGHSPWVAKSQTQLERLSTHSCTWIVDSLCCIAEPSVGSDRVGHDWSDLAAAAAETNTTVKQLYSNKDWRSEVAPWVPALVWASSNSRGWMGCGAGGAVIMTFLLSCHGTRGLFI